MWGVCCIPFVGLPGPGLKYDRQCKNQLTPAVPTRQTKCNLSPERGTRFAAAEATSREHSDDPHGVGMYVGESGGLGCASAMLIKTNSKAAPDLTPRAVHGCSKRHGQWIACQLRAMIHYVCMFGYDIARSDMRCHILVRIFRCAHSIVHVRCYYLPIAYCVTTTCAALPQ